MTNIDFQVLEDSCSLRHGITLQTWFITRKGLFSSLPPIRRDIYKAENGSVVAFRDYGVGVDTSLYMDEEYLQFFNGEPEIDVILGDQGITDMDKIKTFRME